MKILNKLTLVALITIVPFTLSPFFHNSLEEKTVGVKVVDAKCCGYKPARCKTHEDDNCFGKGSCNIFCCNCDGGCDYSSCREL